MIDGACIFAHVESPGAVAERLSGVTAKVPRDPGRVPAEMGHLGSLRVSVQADRVIVRGSLPEYMGARSPLPFWRVAEARQRIEDALGVGLLDAQLWRLELTADLYLSLPPSAYLPILLRHPTMRRDTHGDETVTFSLKARSLVFYDRAANCKAKKRPAPDGAPLRVELQYGKRLRRQLGWDRPFTLADLESPDSWPDLVSRWRRAYDRVEKGRAPVSFDALRDWRRGLQLAGLTTVGRPTIEAAIRADRAAGRISKSTMYDHLRQVRSLAADPALTVEDDRVAELDAAVRAAAERALGW